MRPQIKQLPKEVVDQIAAGEVVQRPVSVVKELIENSMDAGSSCIEIHCCAQGGLSLLSVTDDGIGIHPADLPLAAVRFATSKLSTFDDLKSMQTFGFRGEALASASFVSKLTIISRHRFAVSESRETNDSSSTTYRDSCAYKQQYRDGKPLTNNPTPTAGKIGTTVKVEDLFYNIPSRKRAFQGKKEIDEYHRILNVAQRYAVHKAKDGVAFVCQRKKKGSNGFLCDLNTQSLPSVKTLMKEIGLEKQTVNDSSFLKLKETACKEVIGHVFGTSVVQELLTISCGKGDVNEVATTILKRMQHTSGSSTTLSEFDVINNSAEYAYKAFALVTNSTYCVTKSSVAFILFINDRLVECSSIKRAIENIYADTLPKGAKPFVYLSLHLPGPHIDVNVHPTKREVALLFEDRLCEDITCDIRNVIGSVSANKTFLSQPLVPINAHSKEDIKITAVIGENIKPKMFQDGDNSSVRQSNDQARFSADGTQTKEIMDGVLQSETTVEHLLSNEKEEGSESYENNVPKDRKRQALSSVFTSGKKIYDPKNLVRTNLAAKAGALEPFLVQRQNNRDEPSKVTETGWNINGSLTFQHSDDCKFANKEDTIDMTQPGAFTAICRCQIENGGDNYFLQRELAKRQPPLSSGVSRAKKIKPTDCSYVSIQALRREVSSRSQPELANKLRNSAFVGCISRQRSIIQWGTELLMINHYELSREMFYQIALGRFGGTDIATLGVPVDVKDLIWRALTEDTKSNGEEKQTGLQMENDPNNQMAEQCTMCLRENMEMLNEYFNIRFSNEKNGIYLVGLPVLLEGHSPPPHGLPTFLLRLATEVNWKDERLCFEGICTELGYFYAELPFGEEITNPPSSDNTSKKVLIDKVAVDCVKHTLFPALSVVLAPPEDFSTDGTIGRLALLSSLYKVFERC